MRTTDYEWEAIAGPAHEWEDESAFEDELSLQGFPGSTAIREAAHAALEAIGESEWEWEGAGEGEWEDELNPVRKVYPDAALEHLAHEAINAESEWEAGHAMRRVVPLAAPRVVRVAARAAPHVARAIPQVRTALVRVAPPLAHGVTRLAGRLHQNPANRVLLRTVPTIARRTIGTLVHRAAGGQPVTPRVALRTLGHQAARVLGSPHHAAHIVRRSRALDRVYHRNMAYPLGPGPAAPFVGWRPGWAGPGGTRLGVPGAAAGPYGTRSGGPGAAIGPYRTRVRPRGACGCGCCGCCSCGGR
jgi:hypothetical protein